MVPPLTIPSMIRPLFIFTLTPQTAGSWRPTITSQSQQSPPSPCQIQIRAAQLPLSHRPAAPRCHPRSSSLPTEHGCMDGRQGAAVPSAIRILARTRGTPQQLVHSAPHSHIHRTSPAVVIPNPYTCASTHCATQRPAAPSPVPQAPRGEHTNARGLEPRGARTCTFRRKRGSCTLLLLS